MATKATTSLRAKLTARIVELSDLAQNKGYKIPTAKEMAKLSEPELTLVGLILARQPDKDGKYWDGVHTVYAKVNRDMRELFPGIDAVATTSALAGKGVIQVNFVKGGASIRLPASGATVAAKKEKAEPAPKLSAAVRMLIQG